ncbi:protein LAX PANICLE 2-like [Lycium ferocissimum]|uniref:protein LAX PANICLE 2-like n=1 Tax=Lycium ferocissimum TaxID=112874 RepID=UPI00281565AC|nr:protein LAX PANICLE 2-like [Lycium ferocissimum]
MTMVNPSQNLSKQLFHSYGFGSYQNFVHMSRLEEEEGGYECNYPHQLQEEVCLGSDLALVKPPDCSMAEDESRTESINEEVHSASSKYNNNNNNVQEPEKEEEGWLQLSIGGGSSSHHEKKPPGGRLGLVELDLLPPGPAGGTSSTSSYEQGNKTLLAGAAPHILFPHQYQVPEFRTAPPPPPPPYTTSTSLFLQQQQYPGITGTSCGMFPQEINWGFRPMSASSSYNQPIAGGSQFSARPFPVLHAGIGVSGPSIDFRVIDPPRRPHSGIWFSLQASLNQEKQPFLHQISKSYLRIKDGRMTIRLVLKYLVNKLQLENESEIEITCRGQQLHSFLTLQHVRDHIWSTTGDTLTLLPPQSSSTTASNHIMVLHYGRSAA